MSFFSLMRDNYHIPLNEQQKAAVSHRKGPALVLAGPGSGKTTVITARTAFLCLELGVDPKNILTITFSRASAFDMGSRYERIFGESVGKARFSTMHSLCFRILHDYERRQGQKFRLIESDDTPITKELLLGDIYGHVNKEKANDDELEQLESEIGLAKNRMMKDAAFMDSAMLTRNFSEIFKRYEAFKKKRCLIDYDDMLSFAFIILRKCPEILERYRRRYSYIQVDEGQDLSKIQFEILNLLTDGVQNNIFIVADDDQSIYAFRGAEPSYILGMKNRFPDCRIFKLEKNYRSTKNIVETSSKFIKKNKRRFDKNHRTDNNSAADPLIVGVKNEEEQIQFLLENIHNIQEQAPGSTAAVIYRRNLSSIAIADALERAEIRFRVRQTKLHFFNHWVVLDVLALLRFSEDQRDAESFERIYYKIKRYIKKAMIEFAKKKYFKESFIDALLEFPDLQPFSIRRLTDLKSEFSKLRLKKPSEAMRAIEEDFNYGEYMRDFCEKTRNSYPYVLCIFGILKTVASGCDTVTDFIARISRLEDILCGGAASYEKADVTLTTMHSSKGLEFDSVFIIDLTDDEIPNLDAGDPKNTAALEEERRLFYVGMTRAKKALTLIFPKSRGGVPQARSAFINEAAACLAVPVKEQSGKIARGTVLSHKTWGKGVVEDVSRQGENVFITVNFDGRPKKLDYNLCIQSGIIKKR